MVRRQRLMSATLEARRLSEAHRLAQARLGAETVNQLLAVWKLIDPDDLDGTTEEWLRIVLPLIRRQRTVSATLAANYINTFRALELGVGASPFVPVLGDAVEAERVVSSLLYTGPGTVKISLNRGATVESAMSTARTMSAAAGMRHVVNGGRDTITQTIDSDPQAQGWFRTTSGKPCHFCAMLAGRGAVYKGEATADFKSHDSCSCSAEPIYRGDSKMPAGNIQYQAKWDQAKSLARDEKIDVTVAFRRLMEDRVTPSKPGRKPTT